MATSEEFIEHVRNCSGLGNALSSKKMFGEYALYLDGKVVAFAVGNELFIKPTPEGRAALKTVSERPAYPGSKLYFSIGEELDDTELLRHALQVTARALPPPKPKAAMRKPAPGRKTAVKSVFKPAVKRGAKSG